MCTCVFVLCMYEHCVQNEDDLLGSNFGSLSYDMIPFSVVDAYYSLLVQGTMNWDPKIRRTQPSSMTVVGLRILRHPVALPVSMFHMMMIDVISLFLHFSLAL